MKSPKLRTTFVRVLIAAVVALAIPWLLFGLSVASLYVFMPTIGDLAVAIPLAAVAIIIFEIIALAPATIAWLILHLRRARLPAAVITGALLGGAIGLLLGAVGSMSPPPDGGPIWYAVWVPLGVVAQSIAFLIIWRIAYPKALQATPAEVF